MDRIRSIVSSAYLSSDQTNVHRKFSVPDTNVLGFGAHAAVALSKNDFNTGTQTEAIEPVSINPTFYMKMKMSFSRTQRINIGGFPPFSYE